MFTRLTFNKLLAFVMIISLSSAMGYAEIIQNTYTIQTYQDDVEERLTNGYMSLYSSDLELGGIDQGVAQVIGLRYMNIEIQEDMYIKDIYIQFNTDERSKSSTVNIEMETSTNEPFSSLYYNLTSRSYTDTSIIWTIPTIDTINQHTLAYRTPNLLPLLKEAENKGWELSDGFVFKITGNGAASSTMDSRESGVSVSPKLIIVFDSVPPVPPVLNPKEITDIYVNEISAKGTSNIDADWIELYNDHDFPVLLDESFYLSNKKKSLDMFQLKDIYIPAKSYVTLIADKKIENGNMHTNFKLKSKGGTVYLSKEVDGDIESIDKLEYEKSFFNITYGKLPEGTNTVIKFRKGGSDSKSNQEGIQNIDLSVDKTRGIYDDVLSITFHTSQESIIKFTTDGSFPSKDHGTVYTSPIDIDKNTVLKAVAFNNKGLSKYVTNTYVVRKSNSELKYANNIDETLYLNALKELPIVSISKNNPSFKGEEELTTFEYFDASDSDDEGISLEAGIKKYGAWSYHYVKNNLRIYFRDDYGYNELDYDIFHEYKDAKSPAADTFKRLELKIGEDGVLNNDFNLGFTRFSDKLMHDAILDMGNLDVHTKLVHVFVNGKYYGVETLRERFDSHFAESYLGGDDDDYERIDNKDGRWHYGATKHSEHQAQWNSVKADARKRDYQAIKSKVDMKDYIRMMLMYASMDIEYEARGLMNTKDQDILLRFNLNDSDGLLWNRHGWRSSTHWGGLLYGPGYIFGYFMQDNNLEFMTMVKDAVYEHFNQDTGVLSSHYFENHINTLVGVLDKSYQLDVARWGFKQDLYNVWKNTEVPRIISELSNRFSFAYNNFKTRGLTHTLDAVNTTFNESTNTISMHLTNPQAKIYFTLDGTDPMGNDGAISESAIEYHGPSYFLNNTEQGSITIRAYRPNNWGVKTSVTY